MWCSLTHKVNVYVPKTVQKSFIPLLPQQFIYANFYYNFCISVYSYITYMMWNHYELVIVNTNAIIAPASLLVTRYACYWETVKSSVLKTLK